MNPAKLKYTQDHEWIGLEGGSYLVGITDYAQEQLGDITYIELPQKGRKVQQHEETAVLESVKAAGDIYAPVAGTVVEINDALELEPGLINNDPFGKGWLFKLEDIDAGQLAGLMDEAAYQAYLKEQGD